MPDAMDGWRCAAEVCLLLCSPGRRVSTAWARPYAMTALQEGRRSTCRRHGVHLKVRRATSRRLHCCHRTDHPVLARAAGSSTVPTGIDRSINSGQLGPSEPFSSALRPVYLGSRASVWPARSHTGVAIARPVLYQCFHGQAKRIVLR